MKQQFKKRDRVVSNGALGVIKHVYNHPNDKEQMYSVRFASGERAALRGEWLRPATSKDFKKGKAEIYKRADKKWDYRIIQKNGNLLASSKQGYQNRLDMIDVLNNNFIDFEIVQK